MEIGFRMARSDESEAAFRVAEAAFSESLHPKDVERFSELIEADRIAVATDGDDIVGTGANFSFEMSIPGGRIPAAGVTMIGVLPSHTRRGVLTGIMRELHADAARRGEPVAILWASESVIYQRFGYGLAIRDYRMDAERGKITFHDTSRLGQVRMISLDEAAKVLPDVYGRVARGTPGMLMRDETWWKKHRLADPEHHRNGRSELFCGVVEIEGRAEGYALYRSKPKWDPLPRGRVEVVEAIGTDAAATAEIWRFLFRIDLMERVRCMWVPLDHPLIHMVRETAYLHLTLDDAVWLRMLDVETALAARSYRTEDRITFEVIDPAIAGNDGVWGLDTTGGSAAVARTDEEPQLRLSPNDLAAVYLGGNRMTDLLRAGRGSEVEPGAAARLDAMFETQGAPYCPEVF